METHTLARYISESTLQEYSFVTELPSMVAAAAMYLAIHMKNLGPWVSAIAVIPLLSWSSWCVCVMQTPTLMHYSGYSVEDILPLVRRMNHLVSEAQKQAANEREKTVKSKYSHK